MQHGRLFSFFCFLLCWLSWPVIAVAETPLASARGPATPALWRVADDDTTIYLFGTVHMLPDGVTWQSGPVASAIDSADQLVLELVLPEDPMVMASAMFRQGTAPGLPPLAARLPEPVRPRLAAHMARLGLQADSFNRFKSWAAALMLQTIVFEKAGLDSSNGIERKLTGMARARGLRITGLETIDDQLAIFNAATPAQQDALLATTVTELDKGLAPLEELLTLWRTGDVDRLAARLTDDMAFDRDLAYRLIDARNARWADWIAQRLATPGVVFVAVGAGHLGGPASVQHFLAQKGVASTRLQ